MIRYLVRRILSGLLTLFLFVTALFFIAQILMPGDFVSQFAMFLTPEELAEMREHLGLNLPLGEQYLHWLGNLLRGDLGISYFGNPVGETLMHLIPPTVLVFVFGTLIAFMLGLWLGKVTTWRKPRILSGAATTTAVALYTTFPPWLAFLVTYVIGRHFQVSAFGPLVAFGTWGRLWEDAPFSPETVMGYMVMTIAAVSLLLILLNRWLWLWRRRHLPALVWVPVLAIGAFLSWQTLGFDQYAVDLFERGLPILITYVLLTFGETMLIMQTSMKDTLHEDYVVAARGRGLPEAAIRDRHAARNALIPVLTRLVITLPYLLTGLVIVEHSHGWPGIGGSLYGALNVQDMPTALGILLAVGVFSLVARLVLDLIHMVLDPRIRPVTDPTGKLEWQA
jgi:peptide/nickel transport system permease protein